jgi:hypothetical protein
VTSIVTEEQTHPTWKEPVPLFAPQSSGDLRQGQDLLMGIS